MSALRNLSARVCIEDVSEIYPPDLQAFAPILAGVRRSFDIHLEALASMSAVDIRSFRLTENEREAIDINLEAYATALTPLPACTIKSRAATLTSTGLS